jgi:hypothetical protein
MKVLLDENIDVRFKKHLLQFYEIYTVNDMKWNGIKNGELLKLISQYNFDCWIVVDKNIPYQQNISQLPCLIIVLNVFRNTLMNLIPFIPQILQTLELNKSNTLVILEE